MDRHERHGRWDRDAVVRGDLSRGHGRG
jgi:hypothetical protein